MKLFDKEARISHFDELSGMSLKHKIEWAEFKIKEFLEYCKDNNFNEVTISFSGGKDSTILLDLVTKVHAKINSTIKLVPLYAMEITFPETIKFIKDVVAEYRNRNEYLTHPLIVPPNMSWNKILKEKGYPIFSKAVSVQLDRTLKNKRKTQAIKYYLGVDKSTYFLIIKKRLFLLDEKFRKYIDVNGNIRSFYFSEKCCNHVKGNVKHDKRPSFVGVMANESKHRKNSWIQYGCNVFNRDTPKSRPLSLWNADDVWEYIKLNDIMVNPVYGYNGNTDNLRFKRLGCSACPFGSQFEQQMIKRLNGGGNFQNRFEKLKDYNPQLYQSQVINTRMYVVLAYMGIEIRNDDWYMEQLKFFRKQIDDWYLDFRNNFLKLLVYIENGWEWTIEEINKSLKTYKENELNQEEIDLINQIRKEKHNGKRN